MKNVSNFDQTFHTKIRFGLWVIKFHEMCAVPMPQMIKSRSENMWRLGQNVSGYMIYRNQVFINGYTRQTQNMLAKRQKKSDPWTEPFCNLQIEIVVHGIATHQYKKVPYRSKTKRLHIKNNVRTTTNNTNILSFIQMVHGRGTNIAFELLCFFCFSAIFQLFEPKLIVSWIIFTGFSLSLALPSHFIIWIVHFSVLLTCSKWFWHLFCLY